MPPVNCRVCCKGWGRCGSVSPVPQFLLFAGRYDWRFSLRLFSRRYAARFGSCGGSLSGTVLLFEAEGRPVPCLSGLTVGAGNEKPRRNRFLRGFSFPAPTVSPDKQGTGRPSASNNRTVPLKLPPQEPKRAAYRRLNSLKENRQSYRPANSRNCGTGETDPQRPHPLQHTRQFTGGTAYGNRRERTPSSV